MAKKKKARRYNASKLAKQSALKKDVSYFIAGCDQVFGMAPTLVELLAKGHRGYMSYNEKELVKLFEKYLSALELREEIEIKERAAEGFTRYGKANSPGLLEKGRELMKELVENVILGDGKI